MVGIVSLEVGLASALPVAFQGVVDRLLAHAGPREVWSQLLLLGLGAVGVTLLGLGRDALQARIAAGFLHALRARMVAALPRWALRDPKREADILSAFSGDLAAVEQVALTVTGWALLPLLEVLAATVLLFTLDAPLAGLALGAWAVTLWVPRWVAPRASEAGRARREEEARLLEDVQARLRAGDAALEGRLEQLQARTVRFAFLGALLERGTSAAVLFLQLVVWAAGALRVANGELTIGALVAFQALFLSLSGSLAALGQYLPTLFAARAGLSRVVEGLERPLSPPLSAPVPAPAPVPVLAGAWGPQQEWSEQIRGLFPPLLASLPHLFPPQRPQPRATPDRALRLPKQLERRRRPPDV